MKKAFSLALFVAAFIISGCTQKVQTVTPPSTVTPVSSPNTGGYDNTVSNPLDSNVIIEETVITNGSASEINSQLQSIYFDFDKFSVKSSMRDRMDNNVNVLMGVSNIVKVSGNCDEWGSDEYNYALGLKRARSVKSELVNASIDASRVKLISYGESSPVCTQKTKACWSKNRRADVKVK